MSAPTLRQLEVLWMVAQSPQPTIRDLGDQLGIASTNGVNDHLKALEKKGLIVRPTTTARAITLTSLGHQYLGHSTCPTCGQWAPGWREAREAAQ